MSIQPSKRVTFDPSVKVTIYDKNNPDDPGSVSFQPLKDSEAKGAMLPIKVKDAVFENIKVCEHKRNELQEQIFEVEREEAILNKEINNLKEKKERNDSTIRDLVQRGLANDTKQYLGENNELEHKIRDKLDQLAKIEKKKNQFLKEFNLISDKEKEFKNKIRNSST